MATNKIDILIVTDNNIETVGGEQESTKIIIEGIKAKYTIGLIQPGEIINDIKGIHKFQLTKINRVKQLIYKPFSLFNYFNNILKIIKKHKPSIIHTQAQVSFFVISFLKKIRLIDKDIILIHTERGLYSKYNKIIKKLFVYLLREATVLITTTNHNEKLWKKALTQNNIPIKYEVIENTAGKFFENFELSLDTENENEFIIGFAGRYTDWKNWPLAVTICEELNEKLGEKLKVKMAIGCLDDKATADTEQMFKILSGFLGERFEGEINITLKEMDRFYYNIDTFILTSKKNTESFGRTLVEAMSRKTAVITTNAGGSVEVVGNQDNVIDSAKDIVERILYWSNNPFILEKEKLRNLNRVKTEYSLENNIIKHKSLYNKILS